VSELWARSVRFGRSSQMCGLIRDVGADSADWWVREEFPLDAVRFRMELGGQDAPCEIPAHPGGIS
jgi:hypothetical protein